MRSALKFGFLSLAVCGFLFQANNLLNWQSPEVNLAGERDIGKYIEQDSSKLSFQLTNQKGTRFYIDLIKNCGPNAINPYFPAIFIKTWPECNAWVHIARTDCQDPKFRTFIDALEPGAQYSNYPFYARSKDFCDAPLWTYGLFWRPLNFWKGHAFAVEVDDQNKTINCLGGVEWGFQLHWTKLRPVVIIPKLLVEEAWSKACGLISEKLVNYKIL